MSAELSPTSSAAAPASSICVRKRGLVRDLALDANYSAQQHCQRDFRD
jgi:hypothetical protein